MRAISSTDPSGAVRRLRRALRPRRPLVADELPRQGRSSGFDSWLWSLYGSQLQAIDAAVANGSSAEPHALFRDLDDDLWALLLTQDYELYPHIRGLLPSMPEPALQEMWNGRSGLALASQSSAFYVKLRRSYARYGARPLADSRVLDFGCGWGRLTRYLSRDVAAGALYGCDPVDGILDICRANRLFATLAQSSFRPEALPFDESFDLAFAFSVFTHLSEVSHKRCLRALHQSLQPEGILIVTVRPPAYLRHCELMHPLLDSLGPDEQRSLSEPRYLFVPHEADPRHPQSEGNGPIDYGEAMVTLAYVRERWAPLFELLDVSLLLDDPHQVMLTLRRRPASA